MSNEITKAIVTQKASSERIARQKELKEIINYSSSTDSVLGKLTISKLNRLNAARRAYRYGYSASAPTVCLGPEKCSFYQVCPVGDGFTVDTSSGTRKPNYDSLDQFPIGSSCLFEQNLLQDKIISYIDEFDIDPEQATDLSLINDLALIDLYKQRCVLFLSAGDNQREGTDFLKVDLLFDPKHGTEVGRSYKEHPVLSIIERLEKRRHKILEELIATRRGKMNLAAKLKKADDSSRLLDEIEKIREAVSASVSTQLTNNSNPLIIDVVSEDVIEIE